MQENVTGVRIHATRVAHQTSELLDSYRTHAQENAYSTTDELKDALQGWYGRWSTKLPLEADVRNQFMDLLQELRPEHVQVNTPSTPFLVVNS